MIETETNYSLHRMNRYMSLWKDVYLSYEFNKEKGKRKQNEVGQDSRYSLICTRTFYISGANYYPRNCCVV